MHILKFLEMRSFEKEAAEVQGRTLYSITVVTFRNQKRMYTQLATPEPKMGLVGPKISSDKKILKIKVEGA